MDDIFTLKIQSLVYGGYGISRLPDGKAVFVPFVLPGETIRAKIIEEKKVMRWQNSLKLRIRISNVLHRAACIMGCAAAVITSIFPITCKLKIKKEIFIEQLQRIAGIEAPIVDQYFPSPKEWLYRNAMQFSLGTDGKLCFADFFSNLPFEVQECHLPMTEAGNLWHLLEFEPGTQLKRVEVRQNNDGELMLILNGSEKSLPEMEIESPISVIHLCGADQVVMAGNNLLKMRVLEKDFQLLGWRIFPNKPGCFRSAY